MRRRARNLGMITGLVMVLLLCHYVIFRRYISPISQEHNDQHSGRYNNQPLNMSEWERKTSDLDMSEWERKTSNLDMSEWERKTSDLDMSEWERKTSDLDMSEWERKTSDLDMPEWEEETGDIDFATDFRIEDIIRHPSPEARDSKASGSSRTNKYRLGMAQTDNKIPRKRHFQPAAGKQGNRGPGNVKQQIGKQENPGSNKASNQVLKMSQISNKGKPNPEREKYLFYLCDDKFGCYGLGDRQRAIVATYYLAGLTGRRFGLIMTSPANFRDFYEPHIPKWDIPLADLPKNASRIEVKAHGRSLLNLDKLDFNTVYPQDIVFLRTNHVFWHETLKNRIYDSKIPEWARISTSRLLPEGLVRLMKPTPLLRESLNKVLVSIAEKIQEEAEVRKILEITSCCKKKTLPSTVPVCSGNRTICAKESNALACCEKLRVKLFAGCPELREKCSDVDFKPCADHLRSTFPMRWGEARLQNLSHSFCTMPPSVSKLNGTIDSIRQKKGFDLTDMNLMCAHIRLGHSKTFPFETVTFNKHLDVTSIWSFLKMFARKGYHLYLASDAQEVKDEAKMIFGERLHMMENKIVHIDHERKMQADEAKAGFMFTLTEQLLMATSCREMVRSHSGYSGRAAEIRRKLMNYDYGHVYRLHNGIVQ